jgi:uncharacterized protein
MHFGFAPYFNLRAAHIGLNKIKRITMKRILVLLSLIMILIVSCQTENYVEINEEIIIVELARTDNEIQQGLMFRDNLCDNCGMLFIFNEENKHKFWMKDTKIPLDMIFINSNLEVVDLLYAIPCVEDPCKYYVPSKNSLYVLETNGNEFDNSIIGQKIEMVIE